MAGATSTEVKIRIDIPLPMPRCVMSSPSHITNAVPAVHVMMMRPALNGVKFGMRTSPLGIRKFDRPSRPPLPRLSTNTNAVDCMTASATVR